MPDARSRRRFSHPGDGFLLHLSAARWAHFLWRRRDRRAAVKMLRVGAGKPADLPIERSTKFELVINLIDCEGAWDYLSAKLSRQRSHPKGRATGRSSYRAAYGLSLKDQSQDSEGARPGVVDLGGERHIRPIIEKL
jgi:hypothetical protein